MKKIDFKKGRNIFRGKRKLIMAGIIIAAAVCIAAVMAGLAGGSDPVGFRQVDRDDLPNDITADIIPEYRTLERALACAVDDDIYVIVTRGEKPTSGFNVSIDKMQLEDKNGKDNLIVYALFEDPQKETAISQIITYPVEVVKTDLKSLPDTIELRIQY